MSGPAQAEKRLYKLKLPGFQLNGCQNKPQVEDDCLVHQCAVRWRGTLHVILR